MSAFVALRALGWRAPVPVLAPVRLSDPTGDAITAHLADMNLWRPDMDMALTRDGHGLSVRIFLPEHSQSDRELGRVEAIRVRAAVGQAVTLNRHALRFVDSWWQEAGRKGWAVLVKARAVG